LCADVFAFAIAGSFVLVYHKPAILGIYRKTFTVSKRKRKPVDKSY